MKYMQLAATDKLPNLPEFKPCKAVLIVETSITPDQRADISQWLVATGCLYMMAWGLDCASWAHSVQLANRKAFDQPEIPDQSLVITTWHEDVPLKDVFWFAKHTASHPCSQLDNLLLLHLSVEGREQELYDEYLAA